MKIRFLFSAVFLFISFISFSQAIQFVSARNGDPLSKVSVFNSSGDILAVSDIDGKIQKEEIMPVLEQYILVYEGYTIAKLSGKEITAEVLKLDDRVSDIEPVIVKSNAKAKFIVVRGHFNVYMTMNNALNVYADGIATYVFDNSSKNLKSAKIEQYRAFAKSMEGANAKKVNTMVYSGFLKLPDLREVGKMEEYKKSNRRYREVNVANHTKMQYQVAALQNKPFNLFGYSFFDFDIHKAVSFESGSVNLRDLKEVYSADKFKLKHKSEPDFHQLIVYSNFIPTEISFSNSDNLPNIKLNPEKSFYHYQFWKAKGFPNMQPVFAEFFKDSLKEQPNTAKK